MQGSWVARKQTQPSLTAMAFWITSQVISLLMGLNLAEKEHVRNVFNIVMSYHSPNCTVVASI